TQAAVLQITEARRQEEQANNDRRATLELALRVANRGGNEIIDAKGVGQPGKFSGKEESEFQEWAHKVACFMSAKFGPDFTAALKWAAPQRKKITSDGGGDSVNFMDAFGEDIVDLEAKAANLHTYLVSFTTHSANKVVRDAGQHQGLEAWRRLHAEYDPTSAMRRVVILGKALEDWLMRKRQYEEFTDRDGQPCKVSEDSLIAAMYRLALADLETQLMFNAAEDETFADIFNRLSSYASPKHSLKLGAKQKNTRRGPDDMDVGALAPQHRPGVQCWKCGKMGHYVKSLGKKGGKGDGKSGGCWTCGGNHKQVGCRGGKTMSSLDDWPADAPMPWWNQSSATEPEAEQNGLDISGDEWLRINYDTGAATTAFPLEFGDGLNLQQKGEFRVASGDVIPDFGRVRVPGIDEHGNQRGISGAVTAVHKPLGSAAEVSKGHDSFIWHNGGALVPKHHPVAVGTRRAFNELTRYYGREEKQNGKPVSLFGFSGAGFSAVSPVVDQVKHDGIILAPLENPIAGTTYEDDWKQDGIMKETTRLYDGRVEFERTDGEWRSFEVKRGGYAQSPLGMDPDPNRWTGRRKTVATAVWERSAGPQMSATAAQQLADDWQAAQDPNIIEESEEFKRARAARGPTRAQKEEHGEQNHAVYRSRCPVCRAARATGTQRRVEVERGADEEKEGPRIYSDYFFMSTDETSAPHLIIKSSRSGRLYATSIPAKGVAEYSVRFFGNTVHGNGLKKYINHSDNEPALVALKEAAAKSCPSAEAIPRSAPVGDHQANGSIEVGVREVKRQMRATRLALEQKLGHKLNESDPMLSWIAGFAADTIAKHRRGSDGKTPYERETGRKWKKPSIQFGEKIAFKVARERVGRPKRDWEPVTVDARYIGHHARTGAVLGLSSDGVVQGIAFARLPAAERWSCAGWDQLRRVPWDVQAPRDAAPEGGAEPAAAVPVPVAPPAVPDVVAPRAFYVRKKDVLKYGLTAGCPGCHAVARGAGAQTHDAADRRLEDRHRPIQAKIWLRVAPRLRQHRPIQAKISGGLRLRQGASDSPRVKRSGSDAGSPPKVAKWTGTGGGRYKRKADDPGDEGRLEERPGTGGMTDVEQAVQSTTQDVEVYSLDVAVDDVKMSDEKIGLAEEMAVGLETWLRDAGEEYRTSDVRDFCRVALELGAVDMIETYAPVRFAAMAQKYGLRPGFAMDLSENKPGSYDCWDLEKDDDVKELEDRVYQEEPYVLMVGPPYLTTAVGFYWRQHRAGRYFLHEHPAGADSWKEDCIVRLRSEPGVYTVEGPMCCYDMKPESFEKVSGERHVLMQTRWMTNSEELAKALDRWCANRTGGPYNVHMQVVGGAAKQTAAYPARLVRTILRALKEQMRRDRDASAVELAAAGPTPTEPPYPVDDLGPKEIENMVEFYEETRDDIAGEILPPELVKEARKKEMDWVRNVKLYDKVPRSEMESRGFKTVSTRWVDVNKGDKDNYNLVSAMPPWEAIKALFSLLVTDGSVDGTADPEIAIFDISRAHFMAPAKRELYIDIPAEDREPGDEHMVGRLNRSMYGFRDASSNWMGDWQQLLEADGFEIGYSARESHRLGFADHCVKEATVLNRVIRVGYNQDGRKYVEIEPDAGHSELIVQALGLGKGNGVKTPSVKPTGADIERHRRSPPLSSTAASTFRSAVMRASFLAQDRHDIGEAVKTLAQRMAKPTEEAMQELKRLGRYLVHRPYVSLIYDQQRMPDHILASVDSDHAADRLTRKSVSGMVIRMGRHVIKGSSSIQSALGLNVGEAEFYALVHGGAHGLGMQSFMRDLMVELDVVVESDSTSAKSFASRKGLGKQRHVQTRYLWIQDGVRKNHLEIQKVPGKHNVSDILTKSAPAAELDRHMGVMNLF
ncbi:unnamed protein product, partial [Prorocentrum cordatum]